jgi:hypothetical protein
MAIKELITLEGVQEVEAQLKKLARMSNGWSMSALSPKADMCGALAHVC